MAEANDRYTALDFNDQLATLEAFKCVICTNVLTPPIMLLNDGGNEIKGANVCGNCYKKDTMTNATVNGALEIIAKQLSFPCCYTLNGCSEKVNFDGLFLHQTKCTFRSSYCPLREIRNCPWKGNLLSLIQHFETDHEDCIIKAENSHITTNINIVDTNYHINIIVHNNDLFLLTVHCDLKAEKLWYLVYLIQSFQSVDNFLFCVEQKSAKSAFVYNARKVVVSETELTVDKFDKEKAIEIDLTVLKQVVIDDVITSEIRIISKNLPGEELDKKMLSFFECPLCNYYMRPPILQCLLGHSVCSRCRPKLRECPTCRGGYGSTRNYAMEALSSGVRYPCLYRDLGCKGIFNVTEIIKHETECSLRPYVCVLAEQNRCLWQGSLNSVVTHLNDVHSNKTKNGRYFKSNVKFAFDQPYYECYAMVALGEVFRVCHRRDVGNQNGYWSCQYIGPKEERRNFKYEVGIIDGRNPHRSLIRTDTVQEMTTQDNTFNQCILLPINILGWFAHDGNLCYYIKISKANTL